MADDLARPAGGGVDRAALAVERQRPDVLGVSVANSFDLPVFGSTVKTRPPGVVPANSVPSGRTASAVTHAASSVATSVRLAVPSRRRRPRRSVPGRRCRSRRSCRRATRAHQTNAASSATALDFIPGTTSPVGQHHAARWPRPPRSPWRSSAGTTW